MIIHEAAPDGPIVHSDDRLQPKSKEAPLSEATLKTMGSASSIFRGSGWGIDLKAGRSVVAHNCDYQKVHLYYLRSGQEYYLDDSAGLMRINFVKDRLLVSGYSGLRIWNVQKEPPELVKFLPAELGFGGTGDIFVDEMSGSFATKEDRSNLIYLARKDDVIESIPCPQRFCCTYLTERSMVGFSEGGFCKPCYLHSYSLDTKEKAEREFKSPIQVAHAAEHLAVYVESDEYTKPREGLVLDPVTLETKCTFTPQVNERHIRLYYFQVRENKIYLLTDEGIFHIFDANSGKVLNTITGIQCAGGQSVDLVDNFLVVPNDKCIAFWDITTGKCVHDFQAAAPVESVFLQAGDTPSVAALLNTHQVQVWKGQHQPTAVSRIMQGDIDVPVIDIQGRVRVVISKESFKKLPWDRQLSIAKDQEEYLPHLHATTEQEKPEKVSLVFAAADPIKRREAVLRFLANQEDMSWLYTSQYASVLKDCLESRDLLLVLLEKMPEDDASISQFFSHCPKDIQVPQARFLGLSWAKQRAVVSHANHHLFYLQPKSEAERKHFTETAVDYFAQHKGQEKAIVSMISRQMQSAEELAWIFSGTFDEVLTSCASDRELNNLLMKSLPKDIIAIKKHLSRCCTADKGHIENICISFLGRMFEIYGTEEGMSKWLDCVLEIFPEMPERETVFEYLWRFVVLDADRSGKKIWLRERLEAFSRVVMSREKVVLDLIFNGFSANFRKRVHSYAPQYADCKDLSLPFIKEMMECSRDQKLNLWAIVEKLGGLAILSQYSSFSTVCKNYINTLMHFIFASRQTFHSFSEYLNVPPDSPLWDLFKERTFHDSYDNNAVLRFGKVIDEYKASVCP